MLLVADGGSTKTDWILQLKDQNTKSFHCGGLNPLFLSEKDLIRTLQNFKPFNEFAESVSEIYFFGAGCNTPDRRETLSNALSFRFKNAFISIENDLLGSALATCKNKPGLSCIMGTESNISFFDGKNIKSTKQGLGYILGEDASGTYFGKIILTHYLYQKFPNELQLHFEQKYQINKEIVVKNIYQKNLPNQYIASFTPFLHEHREHPYMIAVLEEGFNKFVKSHIYKFPDFQEYYCHFVGSIAFHFSDLLTKICQQHKVNVGKIIEKPIDELYKYIKSKENN